MLTTEKRRSKFKRAPKRKLYLTDNDLEILKLFGPEKLYGFNYLTAEIIAAITGRYYNRLQRRLRELYDHKYLNRYFPPYEKIGGSAKAVYMLSRGGADILNEEYDEPVKVLDFDPEAYHPQLEHTTTTNWFRGLTMGACRRHSGVKLFYQYPDHHFKIDFKVNLPQESFTAGLRPDWFFAIRRDGLPVRNFFVELQRPTRKTKNSSKASEVRSVKKKFRDYYYFYKLEGFNHISEEDYPDVMNLKNMRVLILTDTGDQEHENLIKLARDVDERGRGLRLFWFARVQDFDINRPESLFKEVWRTPVQGDKHWSILN